jgi:hypothetical protein
VHRYRVRRTFPLLLTLAVAVAVAVTAAPGSARHASLKPGPWCGGPLWRVLTFSDADRGKVSMTPVDTSIPAIGTFARPTRITGRRTTPFQRHLWHFEVIVDRYRIGSDGEIALILYDIPSNRYMNAYLANPHCLTKGTRARKRIVAARAALTSRCPQVTAAWQLLGITARITGVGYWNPYTSTRGALPNGAELRPIVDFQVVSGCGVG